MTLKIWTTKEKVVKKRTVVSFKKLLCNKEKRDRVKRLPTEWEKLICELFICE